MSQGLTEQVGHTDPEGMMLAQWFSHLGEMGEPQAHLTPLSHRELQLGPAPSLSMRSWSFPWLEAKLPTAPSVGLFSCKLGASGPHSSHPL